MTINTLPASSGARAISMGVSRADRRLMALLLTLASMLVAMMTIISPAYADDDDDHKKYRKSEKYPAPKYDRRDHDRRDRDGRNERHDNNYYGGGSYGGNRQYVIACNSNDYRYEFCRVNGRIERAWIANQRSLAECTLGYTWGFSRSGVWTTNGCRAEFGVLTNSRARGYTGYDTPRGQYSGNGYGSGGYGSGGYGSGGYGSGGYGNTGYGGDHDYDDDDHYYSGSRDNRSSRYAVDQCYRQVSRDLRRDGYRNVRIDRVANVDRTDHGWKVKMLISTVGGRGNDPYRNSSYGRQHRHTARVKCKVTRNSVRIKDFDWYQ